MSEHSQLPDLVVFDIAGTTVVDDGEVGRCFQDTLATEGLSVPDESVNEVMGLPKRLAIRQLLEEYAPEKLTDTLIDRLHDDFERRMIDHYLNSPDVAVYPGVTALFRELRRNGVAVAVNTGFPRPILDAIMERLGWRVGQTVDGAIASDEAPRGRPYADMVHHLMRQLGLTDPKRVAKVGDTPSDIAEGKAAGCGWVIAVTYGTHTREELEIEIPSHLADNIAQIARIFDLSMSV